jgi:hypothetical protein
MGHYCVCNGKDSRNAMRLIVVDFASYIVQDASPLIAIIKSLKKQGVFFYNRHDCGRSSQKWLCQFALIN